MIKSLFKIVGEWTWPMWGLLALAAITAPLFSIPLYTFLLITFMLFMQNVSFTLVSRSRQSNNLKYNAIASVGSNGFYIFFMSEFVKLHNNVPFKMWYVLCTVVGSVFMHWLAITKIEKNKKDVNATRQELANLREELLALINGRSREASAN